MTRYLICTIITKNYLAHARVLAESIREHNPGLPPLLVLLADRVDSCFDPNKEPFQMIHLEDLSDLEAVQEMSFYYTPFEFCCALRGCLHEYILDRTEAQSWMFLDSDILVLHDLSGIFSQIDSSSIVLNPHLSAPANPEDFEIVEMGMLHAGLFNAGFQGLRRSVETRAFISWFQERLRWYCLDDHPFLFVDQAWLNHVPLFFGGVSLLHDIGANLGHWNIRGHKISRSQQRFLVDGIPIKFIHFSGWDPGIPDQVSRHNLHLDTSACPGWDELAAGYARLLYKFGYDTVRKLPYAFHTFDNGIPVCRHHRRAYYGSLRERRWEGGNPFSAQKEFSALDKKPLPLDEKPLPLLENLVNRLRTKVKAWG